MSRASSSSPTGSPLIIDTDTASPRKPNMTFEPSDRKLSHIIGDTPTAPYHWHLTYPMIVLSRARAFLPRIKEANTTLLETPKNLEEVDPDQPFIEMSLGLIGDSITEGQDEVPSQEEEEEEDAPPPNGLIHELE